MVDWFARIAAQRLGPARPLRPALLPALAPRRPRSASATFDPEFSDEAAFIARDARHTEPLAVVPTVSAPSALRATFAAASTPATPAARSPPIAAPTDFNEPSAMTARDDGSRSGRDARVPRPSGSPPDLSMPHRRSPIDDDRPRRSAAVSATPTPTLGRSTAPLAADRAAALRTTPASATAQAPVVHVHIERLEVRAPAAAQRPAPALRSRAKSADTLAEYLRAGVRR